MPANPDPEVGRQPLPLEKGLQDQGSLEASRRTDVVARGDVDETLQSGWLHRLHLAPCWNEPEPARQEPLHVGQGKVPEPDLDEQQKKPSLPENPAFFPRQVHQRCNLSFH